MTEEAVEGPDSPSPKPIDFDPFSVFPLMARTSGWKSRVFLVLLPLLFGLGLIISASDGSLGSVNDFQLVDDLRRVFGTAPVSASLPRFPFLRDFSSWILLFFAVTTIVIIHHQWRAMQTCLGKLIANRVVVSRDMSDCSWIHRHLGFQSFKPTSEVSGLSRLVNRVNGFMAFMGRASVFVGAVAAGLVFLIVLSEQRNGVFAVLAPSGLSRQAHAAWLKAAYTSWWAGSHYGAGILLYCLTGWLAVFMILLQNIVGFACVYLVVGLPLVATLDVDWLNPDGSYGWRPLVGVYRTVVQSLCINGLTLSFLFVSLGSRDFRWLLPLVGLWALVLPFYVILPFYVFNKVGAAAADRHVSKLLLSLSPDGGADGQIESLLIDLLIRSEIRDIRRRDVKILRPRVLETSALSSTILLPIGLAIAQTVFSLNFGVHK